MFPASSFPVASVLHPLSNLEIDWNQPGSSLAARTAAAHVQGRCSSAAERIAVGLSLVCTVADPASLAVDTAADLASLAVDTAADPASLAVDTAADPASLAVDTAADNRRANDHGI